MSKYIFSGILGNNCGTVLPYIGPTRRLKEKGFIVENGIPTLRGYAKISDLRMLPKPNMKNINEKLRKIMLFQIF